jgi:hypothetical protein
MNQPHQSDTRGNAVLGFQIFRLLGMVCGAVLALVGIGWAVVGLFKREMRRVTVGLILVIVGVFLIFVINAALAM